jgi:hypothetical protein
MVYANRSRRTSRIDATHRDAFRVVEGVEAVNGRDEFRRLGLIPDRK